MRAILPLNLTAEGMVVSVDHFVRLCLLYTSDAADE